MVPRKIGDQLLNDFLAACNKFFEARNAATADARSEQQENLQKKQEVVAKIKALAEKDEECTQEAIKALQDEYAAIGHVPFKEKDKLYDAYREALDEAYGKMRKMRRNAAKANHSSQGGGHPMSAQKRYNEKKEELATMENNLLFLTASSKKGNSLIDTMKQKIERLKEELEELKEEL
jgi:chromosome segregation ATPase